MSVSLLLRRVGKFLAARDYVAGDISLTADGNPALLGFDHTEVARWCLEDVLRVETEGDVNQFIAAQDAICAVAGCFGFDPTWDYDSDGARVYRTKAAVLNLINAAAARMAAIERGQHERPETRGDAGRRRFREP